jgi:acetyl esterase/lipase
MSCTGIARFTTVLDHPDLAQAVAQEFNRPDIPLYDVFMPPPGTPVRGVVITIHGGAWFMVGQKYMNDMLDRVERWNNRGYIAVNIDYRQGANSVRDVLDFYDAVRAWKGPDMEVGATGTSAGGHLALMIAKERPDLNWVVSEAGPTDLTRLDDGTANSKTLQDIANRYWDAQGRIDNSPALSDQPINARILLTGASNDEMVTPRQMQLMKARHPQAETVVLDPGNTPYVHAWVSPASLQQVILAEDRIAAGQ